MNVLNKKQMMDTLSEDIVQAEVELRKKTLRQIQYETALKWAARAMVAYRLGATDDAHEYAHEAAEHAALTGDVSLVEFVWSHFRRQGIEY